VSNPRNIAGPAVRRLRYQARLTQPQLAARCSRWGWNLSRETLAKIEAQIRWISDFELICLAGALDCETSDLLPKKQEAKKLLEDYFTRLSRSPSFE
jgi:transcriptional regulator with XRE-family HTH domain